MLSGCYSFTGGSIPEHLKTLYIANVEDNSGYGNPLYRDFLAQQLFDIFRDDNSFSITETDGDARLQITIAAIKDQTIGIEAGSSSGELESERKIVVSCEADYYDAVKKKSIWKKSFSNYGTYNVANSSTERDAAVQGALKQTADDILLAVVSGW
jgi:hypothetical protein